MQLAKVYANMESYISGYSKAIPVNTPQAMLTSFAWSFAITTIATSNPAIGIIHGGFCAIATGINGLVTPLFKKFSENNMLLTQNQNFLRGAISAIGACCLASACGYTYAMNRLAMSCLINTCINNGHSQHQFDKTNLIFV